VSVERLFACYGLAVLVLQAVLIASVLVRAWRERRETDALDEALREHTRQW